MKMGTRMLLMDSMRKRGRMGRDGDGDGRYNETRNMMHDGNRYGAYNTYNTYSDMNYRHMPTYGMDGNEMRYNEGTHYRYEDDMEDRFRDRHGRTHYDNGRYAPQNRYDGDGYVEGRRRRSARTGRFIENAYPSYDREEMSMKYPDYDPMERDYGAESDMYSRGRVIPYRNPQRKIGFDIAGRMDEMKSKEFDDDIYWKNEMENKKGEHRMGYASSSEHSYPKMDEKTAKEWVHGMKNDKGEHGEHWNMEQAKKIMEQNNIECSLPEFYAAINAMYYDFGQVAKKIGVSNLQFFAHMAKAFIDDPDSVDNKLMAYYCNIVEH